MASATLCEFVCVMCVHLLLESVSAFKVLISVVCSQWVPATMAMWTCLNVFLKVAVHLFAAAAAFLLLLFLDSNHGQSQSNLSAAACTHCSHIAFLLALENVRRHFASFTELPCQSDYWPTMRISRWHCAALSMLSQAGLLQGPANHRHCPQCGLSQFEHSPASLPAAHWKSRIDWQQC